MPGAGKVEVEGIGVLHQELAPAHQPEARPHLVAELPLDVIEVERQILVGAHIGAEDLGDHLLVGRAVEHVALVAVLDAQHLLAVGLVAPALAPQVGRLDGRHQQLDGAGAVLLLAHDLRRSSAAPAVRAAGRHRCRRPPAGSCRRAASADGRRSPPPSGFRAGSAGSSGTGACRLARIGHRGRCASETGSARKRQGRQWLSAMRRDINRCGRSRARYAGASGTQQNCGRLPSSLMTIPPGSISVAMLCRAAFLEWLLTCSGGSAKAVQVVGG